ncbi:MAG: hemolysin-type calcium-binding repeat family protein, partial [Rhizobium sp.]|nr:hemolysin-type calcium-binding repeat family protein [Rhizobium sp.]
DYVTDFSHAEGDIFDFHAIDANSKVKGNQNFKFIGDSNFHHKAGELHYVVFDTYVEIEGDRNGDGKADFFIAAQDISSLVKGDFHQ